MSEKQIVDHMFKENILFANFYDSVNIPNYSMSVQPGNKNGINSSIIGGYSIGIYKYITEEKKKAALEVIKYFSSREFQKEVIVKQLGLITFLEELYNDYEACKSINCDMLHEIQYFHRPISTMENYNDFSKRAMDYFQDLLDGKKTVEDTLNSIDDINRIYYFTIYSTLGGVILGLLLLVLVIVLISMNLIFIPSYKKYFTFLSNDLWIIYTIGSILILTSAFEYFALPSINKCIFRRIFYINGEIFIFIPILYKLIINYPIINDYSEWVKKHKYMTISILYLIQFLLSILNVKYGSFETKKVNLYYYNKNFYVCINNGAIGKGLTNIQYFYNTILYISICILIFLEWNIKQTYYDIRQFAFTMIINGFSNSLHYLFNCMQINNYILYNLIFIFINLNYVLANHIYIYTLRIFILKDIIIYANKNKKTTNENNEIRNSSLNNSCKSDERSNKSSSISNSDKKLTPYNSKKRLLNLHYLSSISN